MLWVAFPSVVSEVMACFPAVLSGSPVCIEQGVCFHCAAAAPCVRTPRCFSSLPGRKADGQHQGRKLMCVTCWQPLLVHLAPHELHASAQISELPAPPPPPLPVGSVYPHHHHLRLLFRWAAFIPHHHHFPLHFRFRLQWHQLLRLHHLPHRHQPFHPLEQMPAWRHCNIGRSKLCRWTY